MQPPIDDIIVAIATPLGEAGLGVVRLSGAGAVDLSARFFSSKSFPSAASHTLHHGWLERGGTRLDEAVAAVFRAPTSFTGEEIVEFSCHGSPTVLRELVSWSQSEGARLARPGEFSERAFLNGKIDLTQAEAISSLISARSRRAATAAADQLAGGLSQRIADIRTNLINLLAEIEANLDFVEEDIPNVSRQRMAEEILGIESVLIELLASGSRGRWLRDGARIVMAGRPNVGKSSLFNSLLAEDRAIVSNIPGTTRDTLEESVQWDGCPVTLVDTAGLRDGGDAVEEMGAARARHAQRRADVSIFVMDAIEGLTPDDLVILRSLLPRPVIVALNKMDAVTLRPLLGGEFRSLPVVETSALRHGGLPELRKAVLAALPDGEARGESGVVVTSERHAERLQGCLMKLVQARLAISEGKSEEAIASDLRGAAAELGAITGENVNEAVLGAIFRRFCIGK